MHQDVKLSNFLVRDNPELPERPDLFLVDFGNARVMSATSTASNAVRGTQAYMAPEQWSGEAVAATDQYALAIMAYQLLTGRLPFQGRPEQVMYQQLSVMPAPPSQINSRVSPAIDAVILHALAKAIDARFPSIRAFATALQQAANYTDLRSTLLISDAESLQGTSRTLALPGNRQLSVTVPPYAQNGQMLTLPNEGAPFYDDGPHGPLLLTVTVVEHNETPYLGLSGEHSALPPTIPASGYAAPLTPTVPVENQQALPVLPTPANEHGSQPLAPTMPASADAPPASSPQTPIVLSSNAPSQPPIVRETRPAQANVQDQQPRRTEEPVVQQFPPPPPVVEPVPVASSSPNHSSAANASGTFAPSNPAEARRRTGRNTWLIAIIAALLIISVVLGSVIINNNNIASANISATNQAQANDDDNATATQQSIDDSNATVTAQAIDNANASATVQASDDATATQTAFLNANPDPYIGNSTIDFVDSLTGPSTSKWQEQANDSFGGQCQFTSNGYEIDQQGPSKFFNCNTSETFTNFVFEVTMTINNGDCGGIILRDNSSDSSFYLFEVYQNGKYDLKKYVSDSGSSAQNLVSGTADTFYQSGSNTIAVVANNSNFYLYINGSDQPVNSATDGDYTQGTIGLIVDDYTNNTSVTYTNARVWIPSS